MGGVTYNNAILFNADAETGATAVSRWWGLDGNFSLLSGYVGYDDNGAAPDGSVRLTIVGWDVDAESGAPEYSVVLANYTFALGSLPAPVEVSVEGMRALNIHIHWLGASDTTCVFVGYLSRANEMSLSDWAVYAEPTCTIPGRRIRYCVDCNTVAQSEPIPILPHSPQHNWVVYEAATCTTDGRRVRYCFDCGNIAIDEATQIDGWRSHSFSYRHVSGNVLIPPIVTRRVCRWCRYDAGISRSFAFVWVTPTIVLGVVVLGVVVYKVMRKGKKSKNFVCPYCFEINQIKAIQFRCVNQKCTDVDDIELTAYEGGDISSPLKAKLVFSSSSTFSSKYTEYASCPDCGRESHKVVCPSCHNSLPESSLTGEDMIISIVGSRDVGKSHFVGVIINELIERIAGKFEGVLTGFDDTMTRYEANFGRNLYIQLTKLDLTQSSTVNTSNGAYKPYIYTLSIDKRNKIKNYTLVFFDTAGEDLNEYDTMNTVNRYICKSSGIIFLLDPMQIWNVRNQLNEDVVARASSVNVNQASRPDDIMTRVSMLIRADKKMNSSEKIDIPIAAVFSKFDAIESLIPEGCAILETSPHCSEGAFVMSDGHNVNLEIQSLLNEWEASAFVQQLKVNYKNYSFFAASALGLENSPRSDSRINRPNPHRIEDALLWILKENNVIDAIK